MITKDKDFLTVPPRPWDNQGAYSMDYALCEELAIKLMSEYGLIQPMSIINVGCRNNWAFEFDYHETRFGLCDYSRKVISMSRLLTYLNSEEQCRDTILHEIAHALAPRAGHGPKWRLICTAIGCKPRACYSVNEVKC